MKDWKVIIQNQDLSKRVGKHRLPIVMDTNEIEFKSKEEAFKKYGELIDEYEKKSYELKGHSFGAMKCYHEKDGKDILTYILLYYKGEEYVAATEEDQILLFSFMEE